MESIRLWLVIERDTPDTPWRFTKSSLEEMKRFGVPYMQGEELDAEKERPQEGA